MCTSFIIEFFLSTKSICLIVQIVVLNVLYDFSFQLYSANIYSWLDHTWTGLTTPLYCACPTKRWHGLSMWSFLCQLLVMRCGCSFCWYWWNCLNFLFIIYKIWKNTILGKSCRTVLNEEFSNDCISVNNYFNNYSTLLRFFINPDQEPTQNIHQMIKEVPYIHNFT